MLEIRLFQRLLGYIKCFIFQSPFLLFLISIQID